MLHRDLGGTALLGEFIAVALHVTILSAREAGTTLWERAARLTFGTILLHGAARLRAIVVISAERTVASDGSWVAALP